MTLTRPLQPPLVPPLSSPLRASSGLPWESGGGGASRILDLSTGGTFTRPTVAMRFIGAPNAGTGAFLQQVAIDQRRNDVRGDIASIEMLLCTEGSRSNFVVNSDVYTGYTADGGASATAAGGTAPDGVADAQTVTFGASATDRLRANLGSSPADNASVRVSAWVRMSAGSGSIRLGVRQKDGATIAVSSDLAVTATWSRVDAEVSIGAGASTPQIVIQNATDAAARTVFVWGVMLEVGRWLTSVYPTAGAALTRGADTLSYAVGQYPDSFRTSGLRVYVALDASSAEMVAGGSASNMVLFRWDLVSSYIGVIVSGANVVIQAVLSGASQIQTDPITFSRYQLLTIEYRPNSGTIKVSGATTGDGTKTATAHTQTAGQLVVGSLSGSNPTYGRIGRFVEGL